MEDRQELIKRAKKHDSAAFSELMQQYGAGMYKVAKAILKNDEDVADAMQETALSCWEKISTLKKEEYFKTWLTRILINHCNTIYRKRNRYVLELIMPEAEAPEDAYANVEWMELLQCLKEKYRIVIVLYYVEGFKVREIADLLKISESAVKERMSVAGNVTYSGDYTEKTVLQEDAQTPEAKEQTGGKDESVYSASDNGITVTASKVYSDGYSIYLAVEVEAEEGSFSNIPSYYTRRFEEKASQMLQTDGVWKTGEKGEAIRLFDSGFEGQAVDDHTFIGMMKLDRDGYSLKEDVLSLELSEIRYSDESISDAEEIEPEHRIAGTWNLAVPFSVNTEQCREISVNRTGSDGFCIQKVFVSPYQVIVFTDTPYTTLSPDTYTREDFEKQWGEKNKEIAAGGDQAVTCEEMLAKKHYEPYELAVYNEKGEALEVRYSDPVKTVFAVQEHELSKLHIYVADDADEFGLIKAANEQEAQELSVLDAEVEL